MPDYEDLWNEKSLKEEVKNFLGEFNPDLWNLEANTDGELREALSKGLSLEEFYRHTESFIYQSAWNAATNDERGKYAAMAHIINNRGYNTVFDYGCAIGSGVISFALKTQAREIVGADICLPSLSFLAKRISDYEVSERVIDRDLIHEPLYIEEKYDCIICTEVLEHVKHPIELAKTIYESLNVGGTAILSWSFVPMPTHLPEHFHMQASHPDTLLTEGFGKTLVEEIGFKFDSNTWFNNYSFMKV